MPKISAVINTCNEEDKIERCLSSVSWVDEIIVVDLGSTDKTREIAEHSGAKVFTHPRLSYADPARNESIDKASGDWILVLDPDEEIGEKLKEKLLEIAKNDEYDAVAIPRKNMIFGKWMRHTAWWPDYLLRFFKKGQVRWSGEIHVGGETKGRVLKLPADPNLAIIHWAYPNLTSFLERANRYSTIDAEDKYQKGERYNFFRMGWAMTREFGKRFIKGAGFLDGLHGLVLSILQMYCQFLVWGKLWEKENKWE